MFIVNGVTVINNTKLCCICLEHKKTLLLSRCGHDVCVECYKKLIVEGKYKKCPLCMKDRWIVPLEKWFSFYIVSINLNIFIY